VLVMMAAGSSCGETNTPGPDEEASGEPTRYLVRGTAVGVLAPLILELRHADGSELLRISQDGTFAFDRRLDEGERYSVVLVDKPPCMLRGGMIGRISTADAVFTLFCDGVVRLADLTISAPTAAELGFSPDTLAYVAETALRQESTTVTATAAYPEASITVNESSVTSGMPSEPLTLFRLETIVDVHVTHPSRLKRTYTVTLRRSGDSIAQHAYAKASNTEAGDRFGGDVALDGDTLAVGAWGEDSAAQGIDGDQADNSATDSGAVYVFRRSGTQWLQEAYIKGSNTEAGDRFGMSVALDGDTLVVGASREDSAAQGIDGDQADDSAADSGAVYVFRRSGTQWLQEAYIKASNTGAGDHFGRSVALDGYTLAVGAHEEASAARGINGNQDDNSAAGSGAVYIFQ
jgi:trimeric autotransporter adhesin